MPDLGVGTLVSAGASIIGGAISGSGAKDAAQTQAQAGTQAIDVQKQMYDQNRADLTPYRAVGGAALYTLADYLGLGQTATGGAGGKGGFVVDGQDYGSVDAFRQAQYQNYKGLTGNDPGPEVKAQLEKDIAALPQSSAGATFTSPVAPSATTGSLLKPFSFDITQDPGYQFRLDQGNMAVENSAAARGTQLSGATLKELLKYGSDYASGEYNTAFQRDQATKAQTYSMLTGAAGMGSGATTTGVNAGTNTAASIGNTITGIGNATAAGQVGQTNALSGALSGAGSTVNQAMLLKSILNTTNPGVSGVNSGVDLGAGNVSNAYNG